MIEKVSGEPYDTYVVNHLLTPLAMESTSFQFVEADERYAKDQYPGDKIDDFIARLNDYRGPGQEKFVLQKAEPFTITPATEPALKARCAYIPISAWS